MVKNAMGMGSAKLATLVNAMLAGRAWIVEQTRA